MSSNNSGTGVHSGEGSTYEVTPTTTRLKPVSPCPEASNIYGYYHDSNKCRWVWGRRNLSDMFQRAGPSATNIPRSNARLSNNRGQYGFYFDTSNPGHHGWGCRVPDGSFYRAAGPSMTTTSPDTSESGDLDNHEIDYGERPSRARSLGSIPQASREYRALSKAPSSFSAGNGTGSSTNVQHPLEPNTIHEAQKRERETLDHSDTSDLSGVKDGAEPWTQMADEEQNGERAITVFTPDSSDTSHVEEAESSILVAHEAATADLISESNSALPDVQHRGWSSPLEAGSSSTKNEDNSSQEEAEAQQRQLEDILELIPDTILPSMRVEAEAQE